jgi:hypothetical protein
MTRLLEGQHRERPDGRPDTRFAPGSNVKGAVGGANWCYALPSLDLGRVVCLGRPSVAALTTLARLGDDVVVCATAAALRKLERAVGPAGPPNLTLVETTRFGAPGLPDGCAGLVFIPRLPGLRHAGADWRADVSRLLTQDGVAYVEGRGLARIDRGAPLWLAPAAGEVRAVVPLEDRQAIAYVERTFLRRPVFRRQLYKRPRSVLARHSAANRLVRRRGALVGRRADSRNATVPQYVRAMAAQAGVDLERKRWALAAPGDYPSQKVLLFLFGAGEAPETIVKITRDPELNYRLENEWRSLTTLREHGVGTEDTLPRPLFLGSHRGLAVLGESALDGVPFRERTRATADCPQARAAVEWLLDLGTATVSRTTGEAPGSLSELRPRWERFRGIYRLAPDEQRHLESSVAALTEGEPGFPLVFQHGDPGPWNILVTPGGRPAFLDWEAGEPLGMPLWDLFHFLRSYGLQVSRKAGTRDPLKSFTQLFLEQSAVHRLLIDATSRFKSRTGLAAELIEPLFYTCWMHRALKEAATLPPDRLDQGRYIGILRLAIERRDAPGLLELFSGGPIGARP